MWIIFQDYNCCSFFIDCRQFSIAFFTISIYYLNLLPLIPYPPTWTSLDSYFVKKRGFQSYVNALFSQTVLFCCYMAIFFRSTIGSTMHSREKESSFIQLNFDIYGDARICISRNRILILIESDFVTYVSSRNFLHNFTNSFWTNTNRLLSLWYANILKSARKWKSKRHTLSYSLPDLAIYLQQFIQFINAW